MRNTLVDAGPLIALFNGRDSYHRIAVDFFKEYNGLLTTSWPVFTEVSHMLDFNIQAQIDFLRWIQAGALQVENILDADLDRIIRLSKKYSDVPMDLADASLVAVSERLRIREIITIDSDYYIYRTIHKEMLRNIFPSNLQK